MDGGDKVGRRRAARQTPVYTWGTMRRLAPCLLVPALVAAVGGCHGRAAAPPSPHAEIAVAVDNRNFLDMDVYIVRSGQRIRIGTVPGLSSRILMVRPEIVGLGTEVQFEVHPIGSAQNPISETITVHPGDVINLTIPPS